MIHDDSYKSEDVQIFVAPTDLCARQRASRAECGQLEKREKIRTSQDFDDLRLGTGVKKAMLWQDFQFRSVSGVMRL